MIFHYLAALQIIFGFVGWGLHTGMSSSVKRLTEDPSNHLTPVNLKALWFIIVLLCIASAMGLVWPGSPQWLEVVVYLVWASMSAGVLATGRGGGWKSLYLVISTPILIALGIMV